MGSAPQASPRISLPNAFSVMSATPLTGEVVRRLPSTT